MKEVFFILLLVSQFSCASKAQEKTVIQVPEEAGNAQQSDTISLLFAGDFMQHQAQIDAAYSANGYDYSSYFQHIKNEIESVDWAIGNLEVTLGGKPYKGYPAFSAPDEYLYAIRDAGFNVLITANNHCLDSGKNGLERTLQLLDSLQISHAGTYATPEEREEKYPLILEKNNIRIGLLNYTYGTNGLKTTAPNVVNYIDTTVIAKDMLAVQEKKPDAIIACMHWGIEYKSLPDDEQTFLTDWLFKKGVTHIIGSHPHVVQPMEVRQDSITGDKHLVVYSLGNFISNMSARNTDGGLMVKIELVKDSVTRMNDCSYSLVWTARPVLTGWKNHTLIPVGNSPISEQAKTYNLPARASGRMKQFVEDSRALFDKYNKGIKEKNTDFSDK